MEPSSRESIMPTLTLPAANCAALAALTSRAAWKTSVPTNSLDCHRG